MIHKGYTRGYVAMRYYHLMGINVKQEQARKNFYLDEKSGKINFRVLRNAIERVFQEQMTSLSYMEISNFFALLRHKKASHLGLGDIRLTVSQQEKVCRLAKKMAVELLRAIDKDTGVCGDLQMTAEEAVDSYLNHPENPEG